MIDKYQKALLGIMPFVYKENNQDINEKNDERLKVLQELIDNFEKLEEVNTIMANALDEYIAENKRLEDELELIKSDKAIFSPTSEVIK